MLVSGLVSERGLAPRGDRAGTPDRGFALTAAVRVVAGVHDRAADGRADAHVAGPAGLADRDVAVVDVADLADGGHAADRDVPQFAGGQADQRERALLRHKLRHDAGRPRELRALAGVQFHVVDKGTDRDAAERERVAGLDVGFFAAHDGVADLEAVGRDDISLFAVLILDERDMRGAVRVVFQGQNLRGHIDLVALKIDDAVFAAVLAAAVADGDPAGVVPSGIHLDHVQKALLRGDL